jgi:polyisoprenoid-binding protein YceI
MKNIKLLLGATAILFASAFTMIQSVLWKVKDNYSVKWDGAIFKDLRASILFDEAHPERSRITASIDARTVNTGDAMKSAHIKETLMADKFPIITFESTAVAKTTDGYEATGDLTLKGITRKVKIPFHFDSKKMTDRFPFIDKETFSGKLTIVAKEFNIKGGPPEVIVELNIPVTK